MLVAAVELRLEVAQVRIVARVQGWPVAFIRAPRVLELGPGVSVRARHQGAAVWLEQGGIWATTFHPELSRCRPSPFHREFARRCSRWEP